MAAKEGFPTDDPGLLRRSLDGMPAGLMTLDADGMVIQVNTAATEFAPTIQPGVNLREELEKLTHTEMVDRMLIRREVANIQGTPDGPDLYWMLWLEPNERGEQVATHWKVDWAEEMNERRAEFAMATSHELREPLTTLLGFAEILTMDTTGMNPAQIEAATIIEQTAGHLAILVQDVFDLSRNSFGELRLNLCETDLTATVRDTVAGAQARIEDRDQSINCEIEAELPTVLADKARAKQMISNLINNASVHNPAGTTITVRARIDGDYIAVAISDDGQGLPFPNPNEAFRSFRRGADVTAGDRSGSGIGLSITKRLIQLHRGEIEVESESGEGTVFTLKFPLDHATALTPGEPGPA